MAKLIITHAGEPHLDEILSVAMVLAHDPEVACIERRDPTPEEFEDPSIWILDQGGRLDPQLLNFDHHQFEHGVIECTLSLLAAHLGIARYLETLPWFRQVVLMDAIGPFKAADFNGCGAEVVQAIYTPFAEFFLRQFQDTNRIVAADSLFDHLRFMGVNTMNQYRREQERLDLLRRKSRISRVGGIDVIFFPEEVSEPSMAMHAFAAEKGISGGVCVVRDDRNPGWSIKRLFEDPAVNLHLLAGDQRVLFAHTSGFIAKISLVPPEELPELIIKAQVAKDNSPHPQ